MAKIEEFLEEFRVTSWRRTKNLSEKLRDLREEIQETSWKCSRNFFEILRKIAWRSSETCLRTSEDFLEKFGKLQRNFRELHDKLQGTFRMSSEQFSKKNRELHRDDEGKTWRKTKTFIEKLSSWRSYGYFWEKLRRFLGYIHVTSRRSSENLLKKFMYIYFVWRCSELSRKSQTTCWRNSDNYLDKFSERHVQAQLSSRRISWRSSGYILGEFEAISWRKSGDLFEKFSEHLKEV